MLWLDGLVQGILLGGLYAQYALGMALMFGVMRIVNITHGDLTILLALIGISLAATFHLGPWTVLALLVVIGGFIGWALQTDDPQSRGRGRSSAVADRDLRPFRRAAEPDAADLVRRHAIAEWPRNRTGILPDRAAVRRRAAGHRPDHSDGADRRARYPPALLPLRAGGSRVRRRCRGGGDDRREPQERLCRRDGDRRRRSSVLRRSSSPCARPLRPPTGRSS